MYDTDIEREFDRRRQQALSALMQRELVVAHYQERLDWLAQIPVDWQVVVYHKGGQTPVLPRSATVIELANQGREGETYLHHISSRYESLADWTLFVQGNPFDHISAEALQALLNSTSVEPVQPAGGWLTCQANGEPHHPGLPLTGFSEAIGLTPEFPLGFSPGAQWLVRRDVLRQRPLSFYQQARNTLLSQSIYGYCLERLWSRICS